MRLLLDTQIALWSVSRDRKLPTAARDLIAQAADEVSVSVVSLWEIAIKHARRQDRRGAMVLSGRDALREFEAAGFAILPVTAAHAIAVDDLPPHHADPFDRMLVVQAGHEPLRLLTSDKQLAAYGDRVMVV